MTKKKKKHTWFETRRPASPISVVSPCPFVGADVVGRYVVPWWPFVVASLLVDVDGDVGVDHCCSIMLSYGRVAILGVSKFFKK